MKTVAISTISKHFLLTNYGSFFALESLFVNVGEMFCR